jgi:restriction system protein
MSSKTENDRLTVSVSDLESMRRCLIEIAAEEISPHIEKHRELRMKKDPKFLLPEGPPTEEEVLQFLTSPPYSIFAFSHYDSDPSQGIVSVDLKSFRESVRKWSSLPLLSLMEFHVGRYAIDPDETTLWVPNGSARPTWIDTSPSILLLAEEILAKRRTLYELSWRDFEYLIGELLEREGWSIQVTRGSKDGGIDVIAVRQDPIIGSVMTLWQAKKYSLLRKVRLSEVRELSAIRAEEKATKALMVTTSHLTRGALEWIRRDRFLLGYKEKEQVEDWIRHLI